MTETQPTPAIWAVMSPYTAYVRRILAGVRTYERVHGGCSLHYVSDVRELPATARELGAPAGVIAVLRREEEEAPVRALGVPAINVCGRKFDTALVSVRMDDEAIGHMAAEHLAQRGVTRFIFAGVYGHQAAAARGTGFVEHIEALGFKVALSSDDPDAVLDYVCQSKGRPGTPGLFAGCDTMSNGLVRALLDRGMQVPSDVLVMGVDNDAVLCEVARVPLSSVETGPERVGRKACELMAAILGGAPVPDEPVRLLPTAVVVRNSTAVMASADANVNRGLAFIHADFRAGIHTPDVARAAGLSVGKLEQAFGKHVRRSPARLIRDLRLDLARELLMSSPAGINEIASECGLGSSGELSRQFRARFGQTPAAFRKAHW